MNIGEWYTYNGIPASTTSTHMAGIDIMVVSQDEISNTSLLRIRPWIMKLSGSGFWNFNSQTMTVKADGQSKTTKTSYDFRKATTDDKEFLTSDYPFKRVSGSGSLVSGTYVYDFTIKHEDDGSKTISIYSLIPLSSSYGTNWTVDENIDLPTIPRQSQFDISNWSTNATPVEQPKSLKIIEGNPNYYTQLVVRLMQEPDSYLVKRKGIQGGTYNFQFTQDELNNIVYSKIPSNSRVIGFSLETYSDSNYTQLIGKSNASPWYTATIVDANPTFNDFDYEDINSKTIALTGNSNKIVKGYSTLKVTIPVENKATGQKGATISGYNIGNYSVAYSDTTNVVKEIPNYSSENIVVSAVDSRGNSKSITKLFTNNLINYTDIVILNCEVSREDEIGEKVKIKFDGTWWPSNFGGANGGGVLNELTATYQYQTGNGEFVNGTSPLTLNVSEFGKFSCEQYIVGDTGNGFNISNSYKIKVIVSDKLSSKPNTKELIAGEPAIAIFGNKVALHNKYDESRPDIPIQLYGNLGDIEINSITCKNLFNKNTIISGWLRYSDNVLVDPTSTTFSTSDYIVIEENETYTLNLYNSTQLASGGIMFYNENREWIQPGIPETKTVITFTTPENAKYVKFVLRNEAKNYIQLEKGDEATKYTDYKTFGIVESGSNDNGSWIKYADGTMICTQKISLSGLSLNQKWGVLYYNVKDIPNYPQSFISPPTISYGSDGNNTFLIGNGSDSTNITLGAVLICAPDSRILNTHAILHVTATGKWK